MHESKFPFISRIEFIRSKLSNFSAHVSGVIVGAPSRRRLGHAPIEGVLTAVAARAGR